MFALVCLDCTSLGSFARILQQFCWLVATLTPARAAMPAGEGGHSSLGDGFVKKVGFLTGVSWGVVKPDTAKLAFCQIFYSKAPVGSVYMSMC